MDRETQRAIETIAKASDERLGHVIGLAAILMSLPETAKIKNADVDARIAAECRIIFGAGAVESNARRFAHGILRVARELHP